MPKLYKEYFGIFFNKNSAEIFINVSAIFFNILNTLGFNKLLKLTLI